MTADIAPVAAIVRLLGPVLLAAAVAVACAAVGKMAMGPRSSTTSSFLVGYPIFGTLCYLIALVSTSRWAFVGLVMVLIASSAILLRPSLPRAAFPLVPAVLGGAALLIAALLAQLPAISLDEVAYHLAVPKIWISEGRVIELPLLSHSYFPFGVEAASLPLLAILGDGGAVAAHLLHLLSAIATAVVLFRTLLARVSGSAAAYGTLAVVSTPALLATAGFAWNDWPLLGISVVLFTAIECDGRRESAAALAAGLLTKYTFLPLALLLLLVRWKRPGWHLLAGAAAGSLFFLRNLLLTGNPFEPFFASGAPAVAGFRTGGLLSYMFDPRFIDEATGLALPIAVTGLAVAAAGFARLAGLASVLLAVFILLLQPSARILVPFLVIGAIGGARLLERRGIRAAIAIAAALQIGMTAVYAASLRPMSLLSGEVSETEYLRRHRLSFPAIEAVNGAVPTGSRLLVVGLNELFWFSAPVRGGGNFDGPRVNRYLEKPDLEQQLRGEGITHVVFFFPLRSTIDPRKEEERATRVSPRALDHLRNLEGPRSTPAPGVVLIELRR